MTPCTHCKTTNRALSEYEVIFVPKERYENLKTVLPITQEFLQKIDICDPCAIKLGLLEDE